MRIAFLLGVLGGGHEVNGAESIEWMAYDSDVIAAGTLRSVATRSHRNGRDVWQEATMDVTETLKGDGSERPTFIVPPTWTAPSESVICFLVASGRYKDYYVRAHEECALAARGRGGFAFCVPLDREPAVGIFDTDFREYTKAEDILRVTREAVAAIVVPQPASTWVEVPMGSDVHRKLYGGSSVFLVAPLSAAMERKAQGWLGAPELDATRPEPTQALVVLKHFKSDENVALIRPLLEDVQHVGTLRDPETDRVRRIYYLRKAAYETLVGWGVDVVQPVIEEFVPR